MAISFPPSSDSDSENDTGNTKIDDPGVSECTPTGEATVPLSRDALRLLSHTCKVLVDGLEEKEEPVVEALCKQLRSLRSVIPNSSPSSCVITDAIEYKEELKRQIEELQNGLALGSTDLQAGRARSTQVEVIANDGRLEIHVSSEKKPGLMVALMEAIEGFGLVFEVANLSCRNRVVVDVYSKQSKESFAEVEQIRRVLLQTIADKQGEGRTAYENLQ